jgi:hypothetical protein
MSRGAGWVERGIRACFDALAADGTSVSGVTTEHFCREVYRTEKEKVTKAQRVAVLRVLHRLASPSSRAKPWDRWHGQWKLTQCYHRRRGWDLTVRPADYASSVAPPTNDDSETVLSRKLRKLLGMMGSDHEGERANAGAIADRTLREAGLTWDDVVNIPVSVRGVVPRP